MKKLLMTLLFITLSFNLNNISANAEEEAKVADTETKIEKAVEQVATKIDEATEEVVEAVNELTEAAAEATPTEEPAASTDPLDNVLILELKDGKVIIELSPELAPNHVARIKELVRQSFYDGIVFHRVIDGFMAQTGDPTGTGRGGSGQNLDAEFNNTKHIRGTLSMARASDPNSADSQFFIMLDESPHLDGNYTAFGQIVEGMEFVDNITKGHGSNGMVSEPDSIKSLKVAGDLLDEEIPEAALKLREVNEEEESSDAEGESTKTEEEKAE